MRAAIFSEHGGVEKISIGDFPDPECGPDDAVIKVNAVSLNGFDPMILGGTTSLKTPFPMVPGGDYAGEIVELGANAGGDWAIGDRVCPHPFVPNEGMTGETRLGAAAEFARIPASHLIRTPDAVSDDDAAALPIAYGTAYRMILTRGKVKAGEKILILGATGGVGTCCVQLAKAAGATVIVTGSAQWKLDKLKELGADHVIDTSKEEIVAATHAIAGKPRLWVGGGVDVIINYIGGETWAQSLRCLAPDGRMLTCGATAGYATSTDIRYIWTYELNIMGSNGWTPEDQAEMMRMVVDGEIEPILHAVRPLSETAASIQQLIDREVFGKIVLQP